MMCSETRWPRGRAVVFEVEGMIAIFDDWTLIPGDALQAGTGPLTKEWTRSTPWHVGWTEPHCPQEGV
jgi:hypothetical protein